MSTAEKPSGPLADIRVIEMGTLIAGPFCGQVLGDFGAEVIKIEDPAAGDPMRGWGRSMPKGHSPWWPVIGRNKKSVTLNLRTKEGQDIARKLIDASDVLVENFRPGTLEKWGLGYDELTKTNPGLILSRASGYGQTGPMSHKAGYALVGEAMGGLRYITGEPDRPPARAGISIGDSLAGLHGALGVMMALHARQKTGRGQAIDVSIYESVLTVMENAITEYDLTGYVRGLDPAGHRAFKRLSDVRRHGGHRRQPGHPVLAPVRGDEASRSGRRSALQIPPRTGRKPEGTGRHHRRLDRRPDD